MAEAEAHHVSGLAIHERLDGDKHEQPVAAWLGLGSGSGLGLGSGLGSGLVFSTYTTEY